MALTNAERQKAHRNRVKAKLAGQPSDNARQSLRDALVSLFRQDYENPEVEADSVLLDLEENLLDFLIQRIGICVTDEREHPDIRAIVQAFERLAPIPSDKEMASRRAARAAREAEAKRAARLAKKQQQASTY